MDLAQAADAAQPGLGEDLRAVALVSLGNTELSWQHLDEAERHLEQGIAVARRIGRPFTEVLGLSQWARVAAYGSLELAVERGMQAIELARRHGWSKHGGSFFRLHRHHRDGLAGTAGRSRTTAP